MFTLYSIVYSDEKVNTPRFGGDIGVGLKRPRRPDHPRTKYFMPELHWRWGYPVLVGVMLAIGVALVAYFRSKGWLGKS